MNVRQYKVKKKLDKKKRIKTSLKNNIIRRIWWAAVRKLKGVSVETNLDRFEEDISDYFLEDILAAAKIAEHIVVWSGKVNLCDHAYLKRRNGTFLAICGAQESKLYLSNPKSFNTVDPNWIGWRTVKKGDMLGELPKSNGFLS